jgi:hypothetical protein
VNSLRGSGNRYTQLVAEALQLTQMPNRTTASIQQAEINLREAIRLCPERRDAHGVLAQLVVVRDPTEAATHFLRTVELSIGHDELWAKSSVCVFEHFQGREAHGMEDPTNLPLPTWWTDEALKTVAIEAVQLLPSFEWRALRMHAIVLSAPIYPWRTWGEAGPRTPDELRLAADSYQGLVKIIGGARKGNFPAPQGMSPEDTSLLRIRDPDIKTYIMLALECRKRAGLLEQNRLLFERDLQEGGGLGEPPAGGAEVPAEDAGGSADGALATAAGALAIKDGDAPAAVIAKAFDGMRARLAEEEGAAE